MYPRANHALSLNSLTSISFRQTNQRMWRRNSHQWLLLVWSNFFWLPIFWNSKFISNQLQSYSFREFTVSFFSLSLLCILLTWYAFVFIMPKIQANILWFHCRVCHGPSSASPSWWMWLCTSVAEEQDLHVWNSLINKNLWLFHYLEFQKGGQPNFLIIKSSLISFLPNYVLFYKLVSILFCCFIVCLLSILLLKTDTTVIQIRQQTEEKN